MSHVTELSYEVIIITKTRAHLFYILLVSLPQEGREVIVLLNGSKITNSKCGKFFISLETKERRNHLLSRCFMSIKILSSSGIMISPFLEFVHAMLYTLHIAKP